MMKQTDNLTREQTTAIDLWTLLHDAEQIVVNHAYFHARMHQRLQDLMNVVESYQTAIELKLEQENIDSDYLA
jgi:hypothetical protein